MPTQKVTYAPSARQRKAAASEEGQQPKQPMPPERKRNIIMIAAGCALAVIVAVIAIVVTVLQRNRFATDEPYVIVTLSYGGETYEATYEFLSVAEDNSKAKLARDSFVSWANKGIYDDTVMHAYNPENGCVEGGRYRSWSSTTEFERILEYRNVKDTDMAQYYYSYTASGAKDGDISKDYTISVRPNANSSTTYRAEFRLNLNEGNVNPDSNKGIVLGKAIKGTDRLNALGALLEREADASEDFLEDGARYISPVKIVSVKVQSNASAKWSKYDFWSNHEETEVRILKS